MLCSECGRGDMGVEGHIGPDGWLLKQYWCFYCRARKIELIKEEDGG